MSKMTYECPQLIVTALEEADVLTASGEVYTGKDEYNTFETRDAGEFDDFDFDF